MKYLFSLFSVISAFSLFSQQLYDTDNVTTIEITFTQSNWDQILDTYYSNGNDERLLGTVSINGEFFDSVGVKYKGNSTYNPSNTKNPFNIKLDEYINQSYQDFEVLKLSNGDKDPSFVREVMGYYIARHYMDAPQSNYAKVYVNGTYLGLYASTESVNGDFQEKYLFANRDATRIKCNPANVQNGGSSLEYLGPNESSYYNYYELDTDTGWSDLVNLCNIVDNAPSLIEDYFDIDRAIWMLAYNNVLVNLDSYTGPFKQNYYLIRARNDNMTPIIWDLNQSFGSFGMINQGPPGPNNLAEMDILLRQNDTSWPLLYLILQDDTYRKMYIAHCKTIYEEFIANDEYYEIAQNLQTTMSNALQTDNNAFYTFNQAQSNLTSTITGGGPGGGYIGIKELFDDRKIYLANTPEFQAIAPTISQINYPNSVQANTSFVVEATVGNATDIIIGYRDFQGDRFIKMNMFDDGTNGDATAGDGIYSFEIPTEATDIQFYIYAQNNNAGIFSPQRAEHEFYTVATYYDIVLNEIQAKNDFTQPDQDGEFDDWIEIYNTTTNTIDLSNYFLSDTKNQLDRWAFPSGTTIEPDEYLIVWADADTFQGGLHANFKLSGGGESVYISDGVTVFDKIKYVYFYSDTTYGRYPNGTGPIQLLSPTFKANNENLTSTSSLQNESNFSFTVFPNPSQSYFTIDEALDYDVHITTVLGQTIYQGKNKTFQTDNWSKGIYYITIQNTTKKIIIQ